MRVTTPTKHQWEQHQGRRGGGCPASRPPTIRGRRTITNGWWKRKGVPDDEMVRRAIRAESGLPA
eukprot:scaffold26619_cov62-Isochrysis_galbana.AAC.1